jgi:integrase
MARWKIAALDENFDYIGAITALASEEIRPVKELDEGVSIRALAEYLGHADPAFTLRVYTHLMQASHLRARLAIDRAFGAES